MLRNERLSRVTWHCITRKVLKLQLVKLCPHHRSVSH